MWRTRLLIGIGIVAVLAGCSQRGSGEGAGGSTTTQALVRTTSVETTSRQAYSIAFAEGLIEPVGQEDNCISGRMVDAIGIERLHDAGVSADELPTAAFFAKTGADASDEAEIEQWLIDAFERCGTSESVIRELMDLDDVDLDATPFIECGAANLTPLMVDVVFDMWSGELEGDFVDVAADTLTIAADHCPDYQVALAAQAFSEEGMDLTAEQKACLRQGFVDRTPEGERISDDALDAVFDACL